MARHWRGVAFPNGETDLVLEHKVGSVRRFALIWWNLEQSPVLGGDSIVALHTLHIYSYRGKGHSLPLVGGRFQFSNPLSVYIASHVCDEIATIHLCCVPLHVVTVVVRGTVAGVVAWGVAHVLFLMGTRDFRLYADPFVTSRDPDVVDWLSKRVSCT